MQDKIWYLLIDHKRKLSFGDLDRQYVSANTNVFGLKESIKARNQIDLPANRLVVRKCNGLKVPGRGESLKQLEERIRSIDFSDKLNVQMLWGPKIVADLGLPPDEMLLVQVPGTANDKAGDNTGTCEYVVSSSLRWLMDTLRGSMEAQPVHSSDLIQQYQRISSM
jgi:hypothetical protein